MLKSLRDGAKSTPMKLFLIVLAVGFALWGIGDVFRTVAGNDSAVRVGSVEISTLEAAREFDRARRNYLPGSNNSEAIASGLLSDILVGLAQRTLFVAEAERMGLAVTRTMEKDAIAAEPAFRDDSGRFSVLRFRDTLARIGMNEEDYLAYIGQNLMQRQITDAIIAGVAYPDAIAEALAAWRLEQRTITIAEIKVDSTAITPPDATAISAWYAENSRLFDSPDLRFVTAAILSPDVFLDATEITDAAISQYYEDNADIWYQPERRLVSQMIFADPARAEDAASRLRNGEGFAAVAADMLGLTPEDVSLGRLGRDDLSETLAAPVFSATQGAAIGPVETPLGQHVLMVEGITPAEAPPLEDLRGHIAESLKREGAIDLVYERIATLEDAMASGATIEEAATASGAELVVIDGMDRNGLNIDGTALEGIAADTDFRAYIWGAPLAEPGTVEDLGQDSFFIARVDREAPARTRPLDEVRERVMGVMIDEMAITAARTTAEGIITAQAPEAAARTAGVRFSPESSLRRDGVGFDHGSARLVAAEAFRIAPGELGLVETGREAIIIAARGIIPADDEQVAIDAALFQEQLNNEVGGGATTSLLLGLEEGFDIHINPAPVQQLLIGAGH